jgi:hypothetical protein
MSPDTQRHRRMATRDRLNASDVRRLAQQAAQGALRQPQTNHF